MTQRHQCSKRSYCWPLLSGSIKPILHHALGLRFGKVCEKKREENARKTRVGQFSCFFLHFSSLQIGRGGELYPYETGGGKGFSYTETRGGGGTKSFGLVFMQ